MPLSAALLSLLLLPAQASQRLVTPEMDRRVHAGIDAIYGMRFDQAEAEFEGLRELSPAHPYAYFGFAAAAWARYVYETEQTDQALIAPFEARVREVVARSEAWLEEHPDDAEGWMALGAGHGILARLLATRRQYVKAYLSARTAMRSIRKALELDPELHDARLGLGMYDYYTDLYPRLMRVLAKVVLRGNRQRGIEHLRHVAGNGRYMGTTAKLLLVDIYTNDPFGAREPEAALRIMEEVRRAYPDSAMMHSAQLASLYAARKYEDLVRGAREYVGRVNQGRYQPIHLARGYVMLGAGLWTLGEKEPALDAFRSGAGVRLGGQLTRWAVWALIQAGDAAQQLGRRQEALEAYLGAAEAADHWGYAPLIAKRLAEKDSPPEESLPPFPP